MSGPPTDGASSDRQPSRAVRLSAAAAALIGVAVFLALGTWQIQRRAWKIDLIERVEARVRAPPVAAPRREEWADVTAASHAYRRVRVAGVFPHERETLVRAVMERGPGYWVVTPLRTADDGIVLVNRGFVPADQSTAEARGAGATAGLTTITGLLRLSEPGGAFLRDNDPAADRWFSRDVAAIAAARGLDVVAPYFVDADATPNAGGLPIGGLTVIRFRNDHLVYALTWYALALTLAGACVHLVREGRARGPPPPV